MYIYIYIFVIAVFMAIYSSRCYVLLDWYLIPLLLYILIKLGSNLL